MSRDDTESLREIWEDFILGDEEWEDMVDLATYTDAIDYFDREYPRWQDVILTRSYRKWIREQPEYLRPEMFGRIDLDAAENLLSRYNRGTHYG